jgi:hypothetical protein
MPPASTTSLTAGQVMDRVASLMNDTAKTEYKYTNMLPYLNMAIDELLEELETINAAVTNETAALITVAIGRVAITPTESLTTPHYPYDLMEIQSIGERLAGSSDPFVPMNRVEFMNTRAAGISLVDWRWEDQTIKFVDTGATSAREVKIDYVRQPIQLAADETSVIGLIGVRAYLSFKAGAFCAYFIGEDGDRSKTLDDQAETALTRILGRDSKSRQAMTTRRRPFRAGYKGRSNF